MSKSDSNIEELIQEKNLVAPRVTAESIEAAVESEHYQRIPGTNVTICVLTLKNGYSVVGESACVSDSNFDAELGRKIARENAVDYCWNLFGFHLACKESGYSPV